jgi:predicted cation transporter
MLAMKEPSGHQALIRSVDEAVSTVVVSVEKEGFIFLVEEVAQLIFGQVSTTSRLD